MDKVRILGHDFEIKFIDDLIDVLDSRGICKFIRKEILIDSNMKETLQGQTILHEIIEAINTELELKLPHPIISSLEASLFQVFRDNPELKNYFFGGEDNA